MLIQQQLCIPKTASQQPADAGASLATASAAASCNGCSENRVPISMGRYDNRQHDPEQPDLPGHVACCALCL